MYKHNRALQTKIIISQKKGKNRSAIEKQEDENRIYNPIKLEPSQDRELTWTIFRKMPGMGLGGWVWCFFSVIMIY